MLQIEPYMKDKGLTYEALAAMIGLSDGNTVWRYAHGLRTPSLKTTALLAEALGCKIDDLVNPPLPPAAAGEPTGQKSPRE